MAADKRHTILQFEIWSLKPEFTNLTKNIALCNYQQHKRKVQEKCVNL
jgi:hypothetical protein